MKKIAILWRDSNQELYQRSVDDLLEVEVIKTIGWLIQEDEDSIVIARDLLNDNKDCRGMITIPKENILHKNYLKP